MRNTGRSIRDLNEEDRGALRDRARKVMYRYGATSPDYGPEDLVQEALAKGWELELLGKFRGGRAFAFVYSIIEKLYANRARTWNGGYGKTGRRCLMRRFVIDSERRAYRTEGVRDERWRRRREEQ